MNVGPVTKYRPDIDGLRAIAVLSVILFHLGIKPISGGFVGVDIFFVISGYLISRIILDEISSKTFSVLRFYERRARRIIPAFFCVSAFTACAAYFFFFPSELVSFSRSLIASVLFVPNIFYFLTLNYFSPSTNRIPLLHYWSLGVEEQFYILFPLLLVAIQKALPKSLPRVIFILLISSFIASALMTKNHATMTFFLLPFRAFELLIGSCLSLPAVSPPKTYWLALTTTVTGLFAISISILAFTSTTIFPGYAAALPCIGTAFVLWGGAGILTWPSRMLGLPIPRMIGKISYSLYLVHWPIIVFGTQLTPNMNLYARAGLLLVLSIATAILSFYFVEKPIRLGRFWTQQKIFALSGTAIILPLVFAATAVSKNGFPRRFNTQVSYAVSFLQYNPAGPFRAGKCFLGPDQGPKNFDLALCLPNAKAKRAVLWGDSTAADLFSGMAPILRDEGYTLGQLTASACAPVIGYDVPARPHCRAINAFVLNKILYTKPDLLILSSSWAIPPNATNMLEAMLEMLKAHGIKTIILGPQPYYTSAVPRIIAARLQSGNHSISADGQMLPEIVATDEAMAKLALKHSVKYVSILKAICPKNNCVMLTKAGTPIEFDVLHFTAAGSKFVSTRIIPSILAPETSSDY